MTEEEFEAHVYEMAQSGAIRPEAADKLLEARRRGGALRPEPAAAIDPEKTRRDARHKALLAARIPDAYWELRLDKTPFVTEAGQPFDVQDYNRQAFVSMRRLAHGWHPGAPGLTLASPNVGAGKTLLAIAAAVYVASAKLNAKNGPARACYVKAPGLLELYRRSYGATWANNPGVMSTEQVRQTFMVRPDVLVLDDLGAEAIKTDERGEWARERFFELLDYRLEHRLMTIVTTNLSAAALPARYGAPTVSRLLGRSPLVEIVGSPDYRQSAGPEDDTDPFAD